MIEVIVDFVIAVMSKTGYLGLAFLMVLESMIFPVPSEAVMPFAGYLVYKGLFGFWTAAFASAFGSIIGSLISYYIGLKIGRPGIERIGRYFLIDRQHLAKTEAWFKRRGSITIFIARFIPVVRHLISIVAGTGRMDLKKFIPYTLSGAFLWNSFLLYCGYKLGEGWQLISAYSTWIDIALIAIILGYIIYLIARRIKSRRSRGKKNEAWV